MDLLLHLNLNEFHKMFTEAAARCGLSCLQPVPYQLRHGGVSHDLQENFRDLMSAKARGRWIADSSMRRYEKHGLLAKQLQRLPAPVMARCQVAALHLEKHFRKCGGRM